MRALWEIWPHVIVEALGPPPLIVMFSRNFSKVEGKGRDGTPLAESERAVVRREPAEERAEGSFFSRSTARGSLRKCRPHSWHSTLQRGLARARSRSQGREREKDRAKRASSAINGMASSFTLVAEKVGEIITGWKAACCFLVYPNSRY